MLRLILPPDSLIYYYHFTVFQSLLLTDVIVSELGDFR